MNLAAAIEALHTEVASADSAYHARAAALTGLRVLSALLAHTEPPAAPALAAEALDTISATYTQPPRLDVRKIGVDVVAALAAEDAATPTPEPPAARPQPVAATADDAPPRSTPSAQTPPHLAFKPSATRKFSAEREARFRDLYCNSEMNIHDILARINELPGPPISSVMGLHAKARELGIKRPAGTLFLREETKAKCREKLARARDARKAGLPPKNPGVVVVTKTMKDGTTKEYRYPRMPRAKAAVAAREVAPIAPEPLTSEEVHEARELVRKGKTAPDLADWFGGNPAWWQAWIEQQGSGAA